MLAMTSVPRKRRRADNQLVVAIDIGTTYSGASFQISSQGVRGPIREVVKWPGQATGGAKIPSTIFYDALGQPTTFGAETEDEDAIFKVLTNEWEKADWWKLAMCPEHLLQKGLEIPICIPTGVDVGQIFKDMLVYIKKNIEVYISDSYSESVDFWNDPSSTVEVIITTPNGWSGKQQQRILEAAVAAGLVSHQDRRGVRFVSEGEAALHFCMACPTLANTMKLGDTVVVCDAGGGTVDIGAYVVKDLSPLRVDEVSRPISAIDHKEGLVGGGSLVTKVAKDAIEAHLAGSQWGKPECVTTAIKAFEERLKRTFTGDESRKMNLLPLGGPEQDDKRFNILRGRLHLPNEEIKEFFAPSLGIVIEGLEQAIAGKSPQIIFLVGGLAESKYVLTYLQTWARERGVRIAKPDGSMSKAIANGALYRHQHSVVNVHLAAMHYGTETDTIFDTSEQSMIGRKPFRNLLGEWRVRGRYYPIIHKNDKLLIGSERKAQFHRMFAEDEALDVEMDLVGYRGDEPPDFFMMPDSRTMVSGFVSLGVVKANLKELFDTLPWETSPVCKKQYKKLLYDICLVMDGIELRAFLKWKSKSKTISSAATIIYN